jgi:hypothetical protein
LDEWSSGIMGGSSEEGIDDFLNQERQIRRVKTQTRGRKPVMFNIRGKVLMMGLSGGEFWVIWMRLRIVPIENVFTLNDFIAVTFDKSLFKVYSFFDEEPYILLKGECPADFSELSTKVFYNEGRDFNVREVLLNRIDELLILSDGIKKIHSYSSLLFG